MNRSILVVGKNGQLGCSLQKILTEFSQNFNFDISNFVFVSRDEIDFSRLDTISNFFFNKQFSGIVNCAAFTSVDKAESDFKLAEKINHLAVAQLAKIAKNQNIPLIHFSTDYVFKGQPNIIYTETDETNPLNTYGLTKLKGEQAVLSSGCNGAIIRTSWLYSEFGHNFVKTMLELGQKKDNITVVFDQIGSPTYATNLANVVLTMLSNQQTIEVVNSQLNIYHFSDDGHCSWYDFAKAIFELSNINCQVNPIETKNYYTHAKRPLHNVMNKDKIKQYIPDLVIPHWKDALVKCLTEIQKSKV